MSDGHLETRSSLPDGNKSTRLLCCEERKSFSASAKNMARRQGPTGCRCALGLSCALFNVRRRWLLGYSLLADTGCQALFPILVFISVSGLPGFATWQSFPKPSSAYEVLADIKSSSRLSIVVCRSSTAPHTHTPARPPTRPITLLMMMLT